MKKEHEKNYNYFGEDIFYLMSNQYASTKRQFNRANKIRKKRTVRERAKLFFRNNKFTLGSL